MDKLKRAYGDAAETTASFECGRSCVHFDAASGRCAADSVRAQSHYHLVAAGTSRGGCRYYTPRVPGQKGANL